VAGAACSNPLRFSDSGATRMPRLPTAASAPTFSSRATPRLCSTCPRTPASSSSDTLRIVRVGLIGTGHWAMTVHAASAARHPNVELVGVWGRNAERAAELADEFHIRAFAEVDELIGKVEALTFAV